MDEKKETTVGGVPTGDFTDSGNPSHNEDGTFGSKDQAEPSKPVVEDGPKSKAMNKLKAFMQKKQERAQLGVYGLSNKVYEREKTLAPSLINFDLESPSRNKNKYSEYFDTYTLQKANSIMKDYINQNENCLGAYMPITAFLSFFGIKEVTRRNGSKIDGEGRYINLHEAGTGEGCTSSSCRISLSNKLWNSPDCEAWSKEAWQLEKYGCLSDNYGGGTSGQRYSGSSEKVFRVTFNRDKMLGRTTLTCGDSLDYDYGFGSPWMIGVEDFIPGCIRKSWVAEEMSNALKRYNYQEGQKIKFKDLKKMFGHTKEGDDYLELQFHGEVSTKNGDVKNVIIGKREWDTIENNGYYPEVFKKCKEWGIDLLVKTNVNEITNYITGEVLRYDD